MGAAMAEGEREMAVTDHRSTDPMDLMRRIQLSIDGFTRGDAVSTWVNTELLKEAKAEIERLLKALQEIASVLPHDGYSGWTGYVGKMDRIARKTLNASPGARIAGEDSVPLTPESSRPQGMRHE